MRPAAMRQAAMRQAAMGLAAMGLAAMGLAAMGQAAMGQANRRQTPYETALRLFHRRCQAKVQVAFDRGITPGERSSHPS